MNQYYRPVSQTIFNSTDLDGTSDIIPDNSMPRLLK
jgi:hypothetical protein